MRAEPSKLNDFPIGPTLPLSIITMEIKLNTWIWGGGGIQTVLPCECVDSHARFEDSYSHLALGPKTQDLVFKGFLPS